MVSSKYASDYRLENVVNPKTGKLVTKAVYRGDWFKFLKPAELVKKRKVLFTLLTFAVTALFIAALLLTGVSERNEDVKALNQLYVFLPFVGMVFPIYYLCGAAFRLWRATDKVTRSNKDKICNRFASCSVILMGLAGASLIGHIVSWALNGETGSDRILLAITIGVIVCAAVMFVFRGDLSMVKCGTARIDYEDDPQKP